MIVEFLTKLFDTISDGEKGDMQICSNSTSIKLMSHKLRVWDRVVKVRLREEEKTIFTLILG